MKPSVRCVSCANCNVAAGVGTQIYAIALDSAATSKAESQMEELLCNIAGEDFAEEGGWEKEEKRRNRWCECARDAGDWCWRGDVGPDE